MTEAQRHISSERYYTIGNAIVKLILTHQDGNLTVSTEIWVMEVDALWSPDVAKSNVQTCRHRPPTRTNQSQPTSSLANHPQFRPHSDPRQPLDDDTISSLNSSSVVP